MKLKPFIILALTLISLTICINPTFAVDGKQLFEDKECHICHGITGKETVQGMPRLHGQRTQYIINQINDILNKKRDNNYSELMRINYSLKQPKKGSLEKILTKEEIKALAEFLNHLK